MAERLRAFDHRLRDATPKSARISALYEIAHVMVDFLAAILFVIGSALFFFPSTTHAATWMFLIGSIFFATKPTLRLVREIHLLRAQDRALGAGERRATAGRP